MRRLICWALLIAGLLLGVTGCGSPPGPSPSSPPADFTFEILAAGSDRASCEAAGRHMEALLGVELRCTCVAPESIISRVNEGMASGSLPDMLCLPGADALYALYLRGVLCEIPLEVFEEAAPHWAAVYADLGPDALTPGTIAGKLYGLPGYRYYERYARPLVTRADWLAAVGLDVPGTLEELERAVYAFSHQDPDGNGRKDTYGLSSGALDAVFGAFSCIPGQWARRDGALVPCVIQPEMKEALALLNKWYTDGVLDPEFMTGENKGGPPGLSQPFRAGRIGVSGLGYCYDWYAGPDYTGMNAEGFEGRLRSIPLRTLAGGGSALPREDRQTGAFIALGAGLAGESGKLRRLLELLDTAYTDADAYGRALYGQQEAGFDPALAFGNHMVNCVPESLAPWPGLQAFARDWGCLGTGRRSALTGTLPSSWRYSETLDALWEEFCVDVICGGQTVDAFEGFVRRWLDEGGDALLREANRQFS